MATTMDGKGTWEQHDIPDPLDATTPLASDMWVYVSDIKPDGTGDFTTLNLWLAALNTVSVGALVTDKSSPTPVPKSLVGCEFWARCYSGGNLITAELDLASITCDATTTAFIRIFGAPGHRANGLWTPTGSEQGAYCAISSGNCIHNYSEPYTRVDGIRFMCTESNGYFRDTYPPDGSYEVFEGNMVQLMYASAPNTHLSGYQACGARGAGDSYTRRHTSYVRNNVFQGTGAGNYAMGVVAKATCSSTATNTTLGETVYCDNNTFVNLAGAIQGNIYAFRQETAASNTSNITWYRRNNLILRRASSSDKVIYDREVNVVGGGSYTYGEDDYNVMTPTESYAGAGVQGGNSITDLNDVEAAAEVVSLTADAHLKSGAQSRGVGKDLSALFTTDILGKTRDTWDVGAFAYSGGGLMMRNIGS